MALRDALQKLSNEKPEGFAEANAHALMRNRGVFRDARRISTIQARHGTAALPLQSDDAILVRPARAETDRAARPADREIQCVARAYADATRRHGPLGAA